MDLSQYNLIWSDEFSGAAGSRPASHWFFFNGWGSGQWRDAQYTTQDAYLNGSGSLTLRARLEGGTLKTSYLQTYDWPAPESQWTTFGPGAGKYIEARINLSQMEGGGLWPAFWLFDPSDTYDGNPANGTEIDIMEYPVSAGKSTSWTKNFPNGTFNYYGVANHWGQSESKYIDAGAYGVNLRDGQYHTFGLAWTPTKLTYYLDGKEVWSTTNGVSTSSGQALLLSMEYDQGPGDVWGLNENILDHAAKLPDYLLVDYVRVYEYKSQSGGGGGSGGSGGANPIVGTNAREVLNGTDKADQIKGLAGDDTIFAGAGNDTIWGGAGEDFIYGGSGADVVVIEPGMGADSFYDYLDGTDKIGLTGSLRFDDLRFRYDSTWKYTWISDKAGTPLLGLKGAQPSQIKADDFVTLGGSGGGGEPKPTARVNGTERADSLTGTSGNDLIRGLGGSDTINGGNGNDTISGGTGEDFIFGGSGADVVRLEPGQGADRWADFQDGIDKIALSGSLRFADLRISYNAAWKYTWIQDPNGGGLGLKDVMPSQITAADFTTVDATLL